MDNRAYLASNDIKIGRKPSWHVLRYELRCVSVGPSDDTTKCLWIAGGLNRIGVPSHYLTCSLLVRYSVCRSYFLCHWERYLIILTSAGLGSAHRVRFPFCPIIGDSEDGDDDIYSVTWDRRMLSPFCFVNSRCTGRHEVGKDWSFSKRRSAGSRTRAVNNWIIDTCLSEHQPPVFLVPLRWKQFCIQVGFFFP